MARSHLDYVNSARTPHRKCVNKTIQDFKKGYTVDLGFRYRYYPELNKVLNLC